MKNKNERNLKQIQNKKREKILNNNINNKNEKRKKEKERITGQW